MTRHDLVGKISLSMEGREQREAEKERRRDEMDTSLLVEQKVTQLLMCPETTESTLEIIELWKIGTCTCIQVMQVKLTDSTCKYLYKVRRTGAIRSHISHQNTWSYSKYQFVLPRVHTCRMMV